jgi:DNA-binding MarR family transcriptional regulator
MVSLETIKQFVMKNNEITQSDSPDNESDISSLESHIGFWLRFVSNHVSNRFALLVEKEGVSISEWVALRHLFESTESSTTDLIDALGMTKGAVSKIVSRLEEKQYVKRINSETDKREKRLVLTPIGKKVVPKLAALADQNDAEFFGHLPQSKRNDLIEVLRDIAVAHQLKELPVN